MKLIDREGRLFGKVSVIDVVVVLAIVVMAAALNFKGNQTITGTTVTETPITFQIVARGLRNYMQDDIRVGDMVYDKNFNSGGALGEIVEVQVQEGVVMTPFDVNGTYEAVPMEDSCNLLITVQGKGLAEGRQYLINRIYSLGFHASRTYYTKYAEFNGEVWDIWTE